MSEPTVLIVEDDDGLRYAMVKALEKRGLTVEEATNGLEAVRMINEGNRRYCCVLLDMILPNVHGSSVLSHIARVAPQLAVVAVTGYPDRVHMIDPADLHIVKAIMVKPVDPNDVAAYVQSRCDRS